MTFEELAKRYQGLVTDVYYCAGNGLAYVCFRNGKAKSFKDAEKAERYILRKFGDQII